MWEPASLQYMRGGQGVRESGDSLTSMLNDIGDTRRTAMDLGAQRGTRSFSRWIGTTNRADYLRITITATMPVLRVQLDGDVEMEIFTDRNDLEPVETVPAYGRFMGRLRPGVYYFRIRAVRATVPYNPYHVSISTALR